jgi:hypothetical protein
MSLYDYLLPQPMSLLLKICESAYACHLFRIFNEAEHLCLNFVTVAHILVDCFELVRIDRFMKIVNRET